MIKVMLLIGIVLNQVMVFSQQTGTLADPRDGKIYKTVKIGNQWIMAENLAHKPDKGKYWILCHPEEAGKIQTTITGKICDSTGKVILNLDNFNTDSISVARYGYVYDYATACSAVIPGWHIPTRDEWKALLEGTGNNPRERYAALMEGGTSGFNARPVFCKHVRNGTSTDSDRGSDEITFWCHSKIMAYCISLLPPATKVNHGTARIGISSRQQCNIRLFKDGQ